ncbi:DNA polymerase II large subunit, partial [Candidatus Micrarchaeota archaeon]|nr:DNA polymerase II large subunit [Candidatus Micrarchaeota archaeon]
MDYSETMKNGLENAYEIARKVRENGYDPSKDVEIKITTDVASRVEGIVGPPGIQEIIRRMEKEGMSREDITFEIVTKIAKGEVIKGTKEQLIEQAVRTGVGLLTEGVLVAPTEGISKVRIRENPDGSSYVSVYYAGPIRSAGGTVAALSVVLADIARKNAGIGDYRPTESETERYVEEVNLYETRVTHLQYKPKDDDIRVIVKNCPVCVDGDPTEDVEVSVHKNLERVETNRIRGGVPLVLCEGIALKAAKVLKYSSKLNLGWDWLEKIIKIKVKKDKVEIKPDETYLEGLVAGRPVFCYPSRAGGFRLRYGKSRTNGIMAKCISSAVMPLLEEFLAYGTHMKIERPGKGCVVTTCEELEKPVVKLLDGSVVRVPDIETAEKLQPEIEQILFLGDILITVGDFLKTNHPLLPPGYCREWWEKEVEEKGLKRENFENPEDAFEFSIKHGVPLHPDYLFFWDCISKEELAELAEFISGAEKKDVGYEISLEERPKKILEKLLVEHTLKNGKIGISGRDGWVLLKTLGMEDGVTAEKI